MPKNIKQRERQSHTIRKFDREVAFTSRIKRRMIDQYKKTRREKSNKEDKENSNATNYATSKVIRVGKRGSKESVFAITGVSRNAYKNARLKLAEKKMQRNKEKEENKESENIIKTRDNVIQEEAKEIKEKNYPQNNVRNIRQERTNQLKERALYQESTTDSIEEETKTQVIKEYQKKKLIKEKQDYKNIKEDSYKDNGIKKNTNTLKIKTRENNKTINNKATKTEIKKPNSNDLMRKSNIQKTKESATKLKDKAKKTGKAAVNGSKKVASGVKGIGIFLGAGGGFVLLLMVIIIMIAGVFKSMFGIFFTDETSSKNIGSISVGTAIQELKQDVDDEIEDIKQRVSYDKVVVDKNPIYWKDIIAIYAVIASNRDGIDVANMDERAYNKLKEIFNEVVDIDYETSTYYVTHVYTVNGEQVREREARTRLEINVNCMTFDEMVGKYSFNVSEYNQAVELMKPEYDDMWEVIFENL